MIKKVILSIFMLVSLAQMSAQDKKPIPLEEKDPSIKSVVNKKADANEGPLLIIFHKEEEYRLDSSSDFKLNNIGPELVDHVNVLKGDTATKKYGSAAEVGVVEITLKEDAENPLPRELKSKTRLKKSQMRKSQL